jgi:broad specificity phosphatase PhoE
VRHGQSAGNVDEDEYSRTPDSKVELTELGWSQARAAGQRLGALLRSDPSVHGCNTDPESSLGKVFVYSSPYRRCQQTLEGLLDGAGIARSDLIGDVEEPRLREQDFGNFQQPGLMKKLKEERGRFGRFYYRFPQGESGADVYDRVSTWLESLFREMAHGDIDDQTNLVIVTHGLTGRLFLMRWFHWTVDVFEQTTNPSNGALLTMERGDITGRGNIGYHLAHETRIELGLDPEASADGSSQPPLDTRSRQPLTPMPDSQPSHSQKRASISNASVMGANAAPTVWPASHNSAPLPRRASRASSSSKPVVV